MIDLTKYGRLEENVSFKTLTSFKIGGNAKYVIYPSSIEMAKELINDLNYSYTDYLLLGKGSNIIITSNDYEGVIVKLDDINHINYDGEDVIAGAGVFVPKLVIETINNGLTGLEWASGIPCNVGGFIWGNAGAYLSEAFDFVSSITVLEGNEIKVLNKEDIKHSYRHTVFKDTKKYVILEARLHLSKGNKEESMALLENRKTRRLSDQPLEFPSAGSIFRNPEGLYAGKLIEDIGLKGYKIGSAEISTKHANFIINTGDATGEDIMELIKYIKKKVREEYGIELVLEQEIIEW